MNQQKIIHTEKTYINVMFYAIIACSLYGEESDIFTTACFDSLVRARHNLTNQSIEMLLETHPQIIRLSGGSHWHILPGKLKKYKFSTETFSKFGDTSIGYNTTTYSNAKIGYEEWEKSINYFKNKYPYHNYYLDNEVIQPFHNPFFSNLKYTKEDIN